MQADDEGRLKIPFKCCQNDVTDDPFVARERSREKQKTKRKRVQPEKIKRKIVFPDRGNPPNNFTPLFGEDAKLRTLTENQEQESRDDDKFEGCLPQNT